MSGLSVSISRMSDALALKEPMTFEGKVRTMQVALFGQRDRGGDLLTLYAFGGWLWSVFGSGWPVHVAPTDKVMPPQTFKPPVEAVRKNVNSKTVQYGTLAVLPDRARFYCGAQYPDFPRADVWEHARENQNVLSVAIGFLVAAGFDLAEVAALVRCPVFGLGIGPKVITGNDPFWSEK